MRFNVDCHKTSFYVGSTRTLVKKGAAGRERGKLQGMKSVQGGETERVDSADQRGIDQARLQKEVADEA